MRAQITALRRFFQILILLAALLAAAYWHWGLLPGSLKKIPIDMIRTATGFEADFKRVHYLPFRGISIDQPVLKSANGQELFRAKKIRLATDVPAYLEDNRIVIQKIEVDSPVTEFRMNAPKPGAGDAARSGGIDGNNGGGAGSSSGDPNAPVPLENPVPHPFVVLETIFDDSFLPSNVYLNELEVNHGRISILPPVGTKPNAPAGVEPIEVLREIRFRTQLDRRPLIPVEAEFRTSFGRGDFKAQGLVNLADGRHRLGLMGHLERVPGWLAPTLAVKKIQADRLRGDVALGLTYDGATLVTFKLESKKSTAELRWAARHIAGNFSVKLSGSYNFLTRKMDISDGTFEAKDVTAKNLTDKIDEVRLASASVAWNPELIEIPRIQGTWGKSLFTIEGSVDRSKTHDTKLTFRQTLENLDVWKPMAPKLFTHALNPGSLVGKIRVEASLSGIPSELTRNIRTIRLDIRDGSLKPLPLKTPVTEINGSVLIEDLRLFTANDLFFRHAKEGYTLNGQFNNVNGGLGRLNVNTSKWDAGARFRYYPDRLEFSTFTLESGLSHAGGSGTVFIQKEPIIDAAFRAHLVTDRLAADWQNVWPWMKNLKLKGTIDSEGSIRGTLKKFNGLRVQARARSQRLAYNGMFIFEPIETDLLLDSGKLNVNYARAGFYGGEARANGRADFTDPKRPYFEAHVFTQDTNLAKFCQNLDFIKNKFSGTLNLDLELAGVMNDVKSLKGSGNFRVSDGEIWQTELFKRLKKVAFLTIEGAENVVFNNANGSFTIADGGIQTDDVTLSSSLIDIHLSGRIGFNAALALNVVSRFTSGIIQEASEVGGLAPALIHIAENKITRYLITGTFKDPTFTPQS